MPASDLVQLEAEGEGEQRYRSFLLWAMCHPDHRSNRSVSMAVGCDEGAIRKWRKMFRWDERVRDVETPRFASDLYAERFHKKHGGRELRILEGRLAVAYAPPPEEEKTDVAKLVDKVDEFNREEERQKVFKASAERTKRLGTVLDGLTVTIGSKLASRELDVRASDIGQVTRGLLLLEQMESRRLAMLPDPNAGKDEKQAGQVASTSQRVLLAQHYGGDVLAAMHADAEELVLILGTMREQARVDADRARGVVVGFPGGDEVEEPDEAAG